MTIGSLFSGIGGLELGLERAGLGPVVWQAEMDPFCRTVLAHHWPEAKRFESVQEVDEHAEAPDIICGGFPCQDVSLAGTGAGLAGKRSGLWWEFARCIRVLRPKIVVVENVAALLGRGMGDVLGELSTLGYDAIWDCLPGAAVGAPHRRDRIFVVAWRVSDPLGDGIRDEPKRGPGPALTPDSRDAEPAYVGAGMVDPHGERLQEQRGALATPAQQRGSERPSGRDVADGDGRRREGIGLKGEPGGRGEQRPRGRELDGCDMPQWPPPPGDVLAWGRVPPEAQPAVCRLASGLPEGLDWIVGPPRRQALQALGNAVVPAVAEVVGRMIIERFGGEQ